MQHAVYNEAHGYTATMNNHFVDDSAVKDHVFLDDITCIGIGDYFIKRLVICKGVGVDSVYFTSLISF